MELEIRSPREDELAAVRVARDAAFGEATSEEDLERERKTMPLDRVLATFDGERTVGVAASFPFELTVPGGAVPCAGVTWVGVSSSHRRRGVLTRMMRTQLDDVHVRGEPLAALYASEPLIYGRFGYGISAPGGSIEAAKPAFRLRDDPPPAGSVRLVDAEEAAQVMPAVYERARRTGMLVRSETWWSELRLADPPHWRRNGYGPKFYAVLELDSMPAGYALYRIKNEWPRGVPQGELRVIEAIADGPLATRELWRFVFSIDLVSKVAHWPFDLGSPLFLQVSDPRQLHLEFVDGLWLRLVDVGEALRRRSYAGEGSVVLEVTDAFCPWNEGRYAAGEGAGPVDAAAELRLGVADLASAYLGAFDFHELAAAGRVEELAAGAIERAGALFRTPLPPYCPEEF
jgi:predicted acetyltransferase